MALRFLARGSERLGRSGSGSEAMIWSISRRSSRCLRGDLRAASIRGAQCRRVSSDPLKLMRASGLLLRMEADCMM